MLMLLFCMYVCVCAQTSDLLQVADRTVTMWKAKWAAASNALLDLQAQVTGCSVAGWCRCWGDVVTSLHLPTLLVAVWLVIV